MGQSHNRMDVICDADLITAPRIIARRSSRSSWPKTGGRSPVAPYASPSSRESGLPTFPCKASTRPRGTIRVSTVEATAIDLVGYERHAGGLDQVATVLAELAEHIDPERLVVAAKTAPVSWAQRLGYLLELVDAGASTESLKAYVRKAAKDTTPLLPGTSHVKAPQQKVWRLYVNAEAEAET
jgi:AbiEi antitoxin C-terminal domain